MSQNCEVKTRFFPPPEKLRRYFTTFYLIEWTVPEGKVIVDHLLPEWANLRFHSGSCPEAVPIGGSVLSGTAFAATVPSSAAIRFSIGPGRMWGVGLLPLGWARFVATPAHELANAAVDGFIHPAFAPFRELARTIYGPEPDIVAELAKINAFFSSWPDEPVSDGDRISAIHGALINPETQSVAELVELSGASQRTLERICARSFGFPPKLLLRRQRFVRSLSHYMVDPSLKWIGAMDRLYHDQAQFVRDFRQFMGMTPREYAALDKPIIGAVMRARNQLAGSAAQTLDSPRGPAGLA